MKGIIWRLTGEYGSFRPYYTTTIIDTYPFPPKTSIIGMIGAACGFSESELFNYYEKIKVGIKIEHFDNIYNDLQKIWKVEGRSKKIFVIVKRFLYRPKFTIYLLTPDEKNLIDKVQSALQNPKYPITLGDSDSLFYPENKNYIEEVKDVKPKKSKFFKCLIDAKVSQINGGVKYLKEKLEKEKFKLYPKIVKMPVAFDRNRGKPKIVDVLYHSKGEVELEKEIDTYEFNKEPIYLF